VNHELVSSLFAAALDLPADERRVLLDASGADPHVREEVERLLAAHTDAGDFLETPIVAEAEALVESTREDPLVGREIGRFRIVRELGRGGMGSVYLAVRTRADFEQLVALKVIRGGLVSEDLSERFRQERRILAGLRHPGVANLIDGGVTDAGDPFFAMEYVDGDTVTAYCDDHRLNIEERLRLFIGICTTVQYAHGNLVVHRDLKPSNILVTADGTTKLLDFGIAKLLDLDTETGEPFTREGQRALTPEYAAPEQIRGEQISTATDVYALGVILYRLLTGNGPYGLTESGVRAIERAVCETDPRVPSTVVTRWDAGKPASTPDPQAAASARRLTPERLKRRLSGDLDTVVLKALRKEPERRYHSAEALADDLERHLALLPVRARPDTVRYRASKFVRRHGLAAGATIGLIVVLAAGLAGTVWQASVAQTERDRAELEAARAEQVKDYVLSLFSAASPAESKGADITARELLENGVERIDTELAEQPDLQAEMLEVIGGVNHSLGEFRRAEKVYRRALELRRRTGSDRVVLAVSLRRVGQIAFELGDFDASEELYREALAIQREELGELHADVGRTLNDLGVTIGVRSNSREAEALYRQSYEIQRRTLGEKHPDTLDTLGNLGVVALDLGDYETAVAIGREALELQRGVVGEDHPEVAYATSALAQALGRQGKYDEAADLYREALALQRRLLGDNHPDVATSLNNFAAVLRNQGRFAEAEPLCREVLEIDRRTLGDEHQWVAVDMDNLGVAIAEQGRFDEAESFFETSREMYRLLEGVSSTRVAANRRYHGVLRWYQRSSMEAEDYHIEALEILRSDIGPRSPDTAATLASLGAILADRGAHQQAEAAFAESLDIQREFLREGHPDFVLTLVGVGESLVAAGRFDEAGLYLQDALETAESSLPEGHWRTSMVMSALGELLFLGGDPGARELLVDGYEGLRSVRGEWHPFTRRAATRVRRHTDR